MNGYTVVESKPAVENKKYQSDWYQKNKEAVKARAKAWREANRERYLASNKRYYYENKDRFAARAVEYRQKNQDRENARKLAWRNANLEKTRQVEAAYRERNRAACNERITIWKRQHPERLVIYALLRGKRVKQAIPKWADFDAMEAIYQQAAEMRKAGNNVHVDHIVPLTNKRVCGLHWEGNLQIVPAEENLKKLNHRWPDMP